MKVNSTPRLLALLLLLAILPTVLASPQRGGGGRGGPRRGGGRGRGGQNVNNNNQNNNNNGQNNNNNGQNNNNNGQNNNNNGQNNNNNGQNNNNNGQNNNNGGQNNNNGGQNNNNGGQDPQTSLTLDPAVIQPGLAQDGQGDQPEEGQVPSLTSVNNFINFCLTQQGVALTNGEQIEEGSCNPTPMGRILSVDRMPAAKFVFPPNGDASLVENTPFEIAINIQNMALGNFVNAASNYYAAPQQVNEQGLVQGHSHVVVEVLQSLDQTTPLDPSQGFAFFKGLNLPPGGDGLIREPLAKGLPAGFYRAATINTAANHQPVLVAIAQHGSLDDFTYFTVNAANAGNNNGDQNNNNGNNNNDQNNNNGGQNNDGNNNNNNNGGQNNDGNDNNNGGQNNNGNNNGGQNNNGNNAGAGVGNGNAGQCQQTVTVAQGDDCSTIAQQNNVNVNQILQLNPGVNQNCTNLQPGQTLCIA